MNDEIIKEDQIYIQDIVNSVVFESKPDEDSVNIYNKVIKKLDVGDIEEFGFVWDLIQKNKEIYMDNVKTNI